MSLTAKRVKPGNRYLRCQGNVNGDDQLIAMIPFDAVQYICNENVSISSETPRTVDGLPATSGESGAGFLG